MAEPARLLSGLEASWLPVETRRFGGLVLGRGAGGGGRLSSIRTVAPGADWDRQDLDAALDCQQLWGEAALIRVYDADQALADAARAKGLKAHKESVILAAPLQALAADTIPELTSFLAWPPLAIQRRIWESGGIDAPRQDTMGRAPSPRITALARADDHAAGVGFCAVAEGVAGLHALYVPQEFRGRRLGEWMIRRLGEWALGQGGQHMALAVQRQNKAALRLYERMGFQEVAGYVYYG